MGHGVLRAEKSPLLSPHSRIRELLHSTKAQWTRVQERSDQRRGQLLASLQLQVTPSSAGGIPRSSALEPTAAQHGGSVILLTEHFPSLGCFHKEAGAVVTVLLREGPLTNTPHPLPTTYLPLPWHTRGSPEWRETASDLSIDACSDSRVTLWPGQASKNLFRLREPHSLQCHLSE